MVTASAPGKIILFGEHAVVYGQPALAVPVNCVYAETTVAESPRPGVWIHAPQISLHTDLTSLPAGHPIGSAIQIVFHRLGISSPPALEIHIASTIPIASGLGSGAAVTISLLRALSAFLGHPLSPDDVNACAYEIEKLHHGTPSGIDNTVITYAKPVYFIKGRPPEPLSAGRPFTLLIGDTGIAAPTRQSVADVRKLWESDPTRWEIIFDRIGHIVRLARQAIEQGKIDELGPLMDVNHALLQQLTVSSPELDRLVEAARRVGALGAKLSGGGRGGNMIALVEAGDTARVEQALRRAGAREVIVTQVGAS